MSLYREVSRETRFILFYHSIAGISLGQFAENSQDTRGEIVNLDTLVSRFSEVSI